MSRGPAAEMRFHLTIAVQLFGTLVFFTEHKMRRDHMSTEHLTNLRIVLKIIAKPFTCGQGVLQIVILPYSIRLGQLMPIPSGILIAHRIYLCYILTQIVKIELNAALWKSYSIHKHI